MENKNMFYRGYVELLVLKFLSEKDCYGYEIVKSIKRASKYNISFSFGTLYPTVYKMIRSTLVIIRNRPVNGW